MNSCCDEILTAPEHMANAEAIGHITDCIKHVVNIMDGTQNCITKLDYKSTLNTLNVALMLLVNQPATNEKETTP